MDVQEHFNNVKDIYNSILEYIDSDNSESEEAYQNFINIMDNQNILDNKDSICEIMEIICKISKNHHHSQYFFERIERILSYFTNTIKQILTNIQIFNLFKRSKRILLYLITEKVITIDDNIVNAFLTQKSKNYHFYFFNEIKELIPKEKKDKIEKQLSKKIPGSLEKIDYLRKIGENESYICELIRNDSSEEFISYMNQSNTSLSITIKPSIFETNSFLNKNHPTLIEYAAFFGSLQIFHYLRFNQIELPKSLWIYAIHGRNPDLIHFLEENQILPNDETYQECFNESIKCHHNELARYIEDNLLINENQSDKTVKIIPFNEEKQAKAEKQENKINSFFGFFKNLFKKDQNNIQENIIQEDKNEEKDDVISSSFQYHNYDFMPANVERRFIFKYLCQFGYLYLVKLFIQSKMINANDIIVKPIKFFLSNNSYLQFLWNFKSQIFLFNEI
ncbi:hypothetical protein M9Y10_006224 [Tritrichomonas musculus]|uniref:DUF3447 domain-containing protein n=1 Tax=Tritrichomonas musculus TaxID=1915356 RepID=A0ABR2JG98_9EUKA